MRNVTLYTLNETTVQAMDYVSFYRQHPLPDLAFAVGDEVLTSTIDKIDARVQHIRSINPNGRGRAEIVDHFIAMDPELEKLLTYPIEDRYHQENQLLKSWHKDAVDKYNQLVDTVEKFNNLPWYKRIFKQV